MTIEGNRKKRVVYMLKHGLGSYDEIAKISGESRQLVRHWGQDYRGAREKYLAAQWEKLNQRWPD